MALEALLEGKISAAQMKQFVEGAKEHDVVSSLMGAIRAGEPVNVGTEQVQCYNSLQAFQAHRFVVDPHGTFEVAREMIARHDHAAR